MVDLLGDFIALMALNIIVHTQMEQYSLRFMYSQENIKIESYASSYICCPHITFVVVHAIFSKFFLMIKNILHSREAAV